jgi:hypothetical protein
MRLVVSNILLLVISMVMVLGFFYHGEFYQIGLGPLVFIGSVVVFVVLKVVSWANSELRVRSRGRTGNLLFKPAMISSILYGEVTTTIRPLKKSRLKVGNLCNVRRKVAGQRLATVLITDIRRKRLNDLTVRDLKKAGEEKGIITEYRKDWEKKFGGGEDQIVRIIHFKPVTGGPFDKVVRVK